MKTQNKLEKKVAVLITVHNRYLSTVEAIESVFAFVDEIFVVDDGSTDGTADRLVKKWPSINVIPGDGNLFWTRGMDLAWRAAFNKGSYQHYVWLNNDVVPNIGAIKNLITWSEELGNEAVISGIISDDENCIIYGGYDDQKRLIKPNGKFQDISYLNGNLVLVPKRVFEKLGSFDTYLHHDLGDVDYGFRAKKNGFRVVCSKFPLGVGLCNSNSRLRIRDSNIVQRFRHLNSPLGSPLHIAFYFHKKHFGLLKALLAVTYILVLNILGDFLVKLFFGEEYLAR